MVWGRNPSSQESTDPSSGGVTQAVTHRFATRSASGAGFADVGVASGSDSLVGRTSRSSVGSAPVSDTTGTLSAVDSGPSAEATPVPPSSNSLGTNMPAAIMIAATRMIVPMRWVGERIGQPHSLRYTAARPRLVRMGIPAS